MPVKLKRPIGLARSLNRPTTTEKPEQPALTNAPDGALLLPAEAAKRLGVSEHALERWRASGEGPPFVRLSAKTIRYRRPDLEAFIAARLVTSTAAA